MILMGSLDKIDLNINKILINGGLMRGIYEDGVIKTTKLGILNIAFTFTILAIQTIKCSILIFFHEDSQVAIYLGEFFQYFGSKVVVDIAALIFFGYATSLLVLFNLMSTKILSWIDFMEFDRETRCFYKLNLNVYDSERFTKQFALLWSIFKPLAYFLGFITGSAILASFLIFKHDNYEYYLPWIFSYGIATWKLGHNLMSTLLILYQVNKLIKFNKLSLDCKIVLLIDLLLFKLKIFIHK